MMSNVSSWSAFQHWSHIMIVGLFVSHCVPVSYCSVEASVSNLYVLFLMAIVCDRLPWDLAVTCAISSSTGTTTFLSSDWLLYMLYMLYNFIW